MFVKAAFIQTSPVFGDIRKNTDDAVKKLDALAAKGARIVVLPELFSTGYRFTSKKEAYSYSEDARTGYAATRLIESARKNKIHICAGIAEKKGKKSFNSSILVGPKGFIDVYRKTHLFWNEKTYFSPGDTGFRVHNLGGVKAGMMICFDWVFPEAARTLALKGADVILHPSNLVLPFCPDAMVTRCLENRVYSITANRVGTEKRVKGETLKFIGRSEIVAPNGKILARAADDTLASKIAGIDTALSRRKRITPLNDLFLDRRPGFYKY